MTSSKLKGGLPVTRPLAAIDLGTNTARLLIARSSASGGGFDTVLLRREITRLGGGFSREHGISPEARERTLAALSAFAEEIRLHEVGTLRAVATSAVRDAANGAAFSREVLDRTGIHLEVIDGHEEGVLTLRGVRAGVDPDLQHLLVFDVGGGSTEYTLAEGDSLLFTRSLPLGVVRLTEGKGDSAQIREKIERELDALEADLRSRLLFPVPKNTTLVGTAGTATTLAAISRKLTVYDYRLVNNYVLHRDEIMSIYQMLAPLSPAERLRIPGLERGREDLIIAGILLTLATMDRFGSRTCRVSDFGLLEGVLLSILP